MMACFKKATSAYKAVVDAYESISQDGFMGVITKKYPDIDEVIDTLDEMKECYANSDTGEEIDDKWRPMLLTVGLLYKLQRIQDSNATSWYNDENIFIHDTEIEEKLLHTFGFYWHYTMKVAEALRSVDNDELAEAPAHMNETSEGELIPNPQVFENLMYQTGLEKESIVFAHATDSFHVDHHCPDFAMMLVHELEQIVIVVCGTRMFPAPKMKDVFMDLYADSTEFLHGHAHLGFVIGAKNIIGKVLPKIKEALETHPNYSIVVTGYSLGAGLCQLLAMELLEGESASELPDGVTIRCINFGAPPVFKSDRPDYACPNIFSVVYNNDGLASASAATVTKLFMQIRAVNYLRLRRRDIIKMLWKPIPTVQGDNIKDDDEFDEDDYEHKTGSNKTTTILDENSKWFAVKTAVDSVQDAGILQLEHPAQQVYMFKRKENDVITRKLTQTKPLSDRLRLRGAMFNHHMPWGYAYLFKDYGVVASDMDISLLDVTASQEHNKLYPDLSE